MKTVAIVIPTHKARLNPSDLISIRHLKKYLDKYDKYFAIPDDIDPQEFNQKGFGFVKFPSLFFKSWRGYNELLLREDFYKKFKDYKYILIYQLDVLVFSDELSKWCTKGYDFVAAPWFRPVIGTLSHKKNSPPSGGNGGFSLRNVQKCLKILEKVKKKVKRSSIDMNVRKFRFIWAVLTGKSHDVWLDAPADNYPFAEDGFWSLEAPKYLPGYKVAPFNEALRFAFERYPRRCFEINNRKLPFGCHAWEKYDKGFWLPYLITE